MPEATLPLFGEGRSVFVLLLDTAGRSKSRDGTGPRRLSPPERIHPVRAGSTDRAPAPRPARHRLSSLSRDFGADFRSLLSPPRRGRSRPVFAVVPCPSRSLSLSRPPPPRPRRRTVLSINCGKRSYRGAWSAPGWDSGKEEREERG